MWEPSETQPLPPRFVDTPLVSGAKQPPLDAV
jgi:hypothetical protein